MNNYTLFASDLAYKAGEIIRSNFTLGMKKTLKKGDNSPLTVSDTTINRMVIEEVSKKFPAHIVIGEEESLKNNSEYAWLCDPLDGTIPFTSGVPISTFSLALVKDGVPIVGVIYDPFLDRLYWAEKGSGAFLNKKKIQVSNDKVLKSQVIYIGWWKYSMYDFLFARRELNDRGCKIMDFCSFAYAGGLVAAGEFSAVIFGDYFPWDGAALQLLVEEAGGKCTDLTGKQQRYDRNINGFIASNGHIHKELVDIIQGFAIKRK